MIRQNTKLIHLNLQNTGLNQQILVDLVRAVKRAKSLLGLHLGMNPGVTEEVRRFWEQRITILGF
jgi:hypothetical protein